MPYANAADRRRASRESMRRHRARNGGSTARDVAPVAPRTGGTESDLAAMLLEEIVALRARSDPGESERCRVLCLLVSTILRCA